MPGINNSGEGNFNMFTPEELIYTPAEMEKGLRVPQNGNGTSFSAMTEKTQEQLIEELKIRQEYKDNNKELQGDPNKHIRQAHRPDLGY